MIQKMEGYTTKCTFCPDYIGSCEKYQSVTGKYGGKCFYKKMIKRDYILCERGREPEYYSKSEIERILADPSYDIKTNEVN